MAKSRKRTRARAELAAVPPRRRCGAMEAHERMLEQFDAFRQAQVALQHASMARLRAFQAPRTTPYRIPVVVHVVYNVAADNISDAQIKSQIDVLNRDFRKKNTDWNQTPTPFKGLVADAMIEFDLATEAPDGSATDGITRTHTQRTSFGADDSVKSAAEGGVDPWPTARYLNMWVCRLGGGLLGYAQFPGGPPQTDGVVMLNTAFGTKGTAAAPFNKGRTTTHEIGHYLNLRHIWGDLPDCHGNDFVDDTPGAESPNYGTPSFPHISCENGPHGDMFMNYMDYVDDAAMFMFSAGQVSRMHTTLDGPRASLVS